MGIIDKIRAKATGFVNGSKENLLLFPERIQLETTSLCPCDCYMCASKFKKRTNKFLPDDVLDKIIEECSDRGTIMQLFFYGDPCLDSRIPEIVRKCKAADLPNCITTPGVALNEKLSKDLLEAGLTHIGFSVDGNTKETYEKIRRGANFEKTMENIESFIKMRNEGGYITSVHVQMVGCELNKDEWDDYLNRWKPLADEHWIGRYGHRGGEYDAFINIVPQDKKYCDLFEEELCITTDGDATICCRDNGQVIVGNVYSESIEAIWNGKERKRLRKIMREKGTFGIEYCRDCTHVKASKFLEG